MENKAMAVLERSKWYIAHQPTMEVDASQGFTTQSIACDYMERHGMRRNYIALRGEHFRRYSHMWKLA